MRWLILVVLLSTFAATAVWSAKDGLPPGVSNTQNPKDVPPSAAEAARRIKVPKGFDVTLFAGEPHVAQPIALAFDDRGRLWVAECYSYPKWTTSGGKDRVLIFEDTDGDGCFDRRKVFLDNINNLTGIEIGHGGVWLCSAPELLFVADRNGDDVPDGEPIAVLDGFTLKAGHNIYNGLCWGPDGWLWGRHGITAESLVGTPGTPPDKRTRLRCSIWRYHPTRKTFEVVTHGTTNPWGLDFDDHGEAFFTNCVIGHLWHVIPGAHYQRMYGQDYNRHSYELIEATSDHLHWGGGHWTSSRSGEGIHSEAGGGHAHSGGMIYLGDNWPKKYRNGIYMCNLHGNRINHDILERHECSYVGKHAKDFCTSDNPWFRGIDLDYGPAGAVYVTDWVDFGECHDNDGVHRSSGRIYRIAYGKPKQETFDLAKKTDGELVELQLHENDWFVRHARRLLAERSAAGRSMTKTHRSLRNMFDSHPDVTRKLRAMWALYGTGGATAKWLSAQLHHKNEHVRVWAIRLLCDARQPDAAVMKTFERMAEDDTSGLVRVYLASALQRLPLDRRLPIALGLSRHEEDAGDRVQPLMIWYGIEPTVVPQASEALQLALRSRIPKLRRFVARRLAEDDPSHLGSILGTVAKADDSEVRNDFVAGLRRGLLGYKSVPMPKNWESLYAKLKRSDNGNVRQSAHFLAVLFNDQDAIVRLRKTLADRRASKERREVALQALLKRKNDKLLAVLSDLADDRAVRGPVLRALAAFDNKKVPQIIVDEYASMSDAAKQDAIATLASRPKYALALLEAIERGTIPRRDVSTFTARQLQALRDKRVAKRLAKVWGQVRRTPAKKRALIEGYKARLNQAVVSKANLANGKSVFKKMCMQCHRLYGEGKTIGPDLTGSNRDNLHYVLENLIDPSATIGRDYRLTNVFTVDGRLVAGIVVEENEQAVTLQTTNERLVIPKKDIEARRVAKVSMMPEGQIEKLEFDELRDLIGYLRRKE